MATFFFISGFFTALVAGRLPLGRYLANRRDVVVYPLVASLILIAPVTNWLIFCFHTAPISLSDYLFAGGWRTGGRGNVWHLHFWFLFSLLVYALLTPALLGLLRRPKFAAGLDRLVVRAGGWTLWLALPVVAAATLLVQALYQHVLGPLVAGGPFPWIVRASLYYFVYFLLGVVGFANRGFFERLHGFGPMAAAALIAMMALQYQALGWRAQSPSALASVLFWVSRAAITLLLLSALLTLFRKWFDRSSRALGFLVDSAYSFYLFHVAVIYLIAIPVFRWSGDLYLTFAAVVLLGVPVLLLWHGLVIRRVPLLRLVFNGKRPRPQPAPGRVPA